MLTCLASISVLERVFPCCIRFLFTGHIFYLKSISFGICFKLNWFITFFTRLELVLCGWSFRNYKNPTSKLKKLELQSNYKKVERTSIEYFITTTHLIYQKAFILNWLANTIITFLQLILKSIKPKNRLIKNTINQTWKIMLKSLFNFENNQTKALQQLAVDAKTNPLLNKFFQ